MHRKSNAKMPVTTYEPVTPAVVVTPIGAETKALSPVSPMSSHIFIAIGVRDRSLPGGNVTSDDCDTGDAATPVELANNRKRRLAAARQRRKRERDRQGGRDTWSAHANQGRLADFLFSEKFLKENESEDPQAIESALQRYIDDITSRA